MLNRLRPVTAMVATLVLVASYGALASLAAGATVARLRYEPIAGPVLAGNAVVWAERSPRGFVVRSAGPDGVRTLLVSTLPGVPASPAQVHLAASPELVAAEVAGPDPASTAPSDPLRIRSVTFVGPPAGPLRQLAIGCPESALALLRSIDVSGQELAYPVGGEALWPAPEQCRWVVGRPLQPDTAPEPIGPSEPQALRLVGGYASWLDGAPIQYPPHKDDASFVVIDRGSGATRTQLGRGALPSAVYASAMDASGSAALGFGRLDGDGWHDGGLALVPLGATAPLILPVPEGHYVPRLAGGRLIVLVSDSDAGTGRVAHFDGTGRTVGVLSRNAYDNVLAEHLDVAGDEAAWVERGCGEVRIVTASLTAGGVPDGAPTCRLRLRQQPVLRGRTLRLGLSCVGIRPFCVGRVTVRIGSRRGARIAVATTDEGGGLSDELAARSARRLRRLRPRLWISAILGDTATEIRTNSADRPQSTSARLRVAG